MIASPHPQVAPTAAVVEAISERWGRKDEGSGRFGFPCPACRGGAIFSSRTGSWSCWAGCGANGATADLAASLDLGIGAGDRPISSAPPLPSSGFALPGGITAADLVRKRFPEPRWAVPGVLPEGATLFAGAPKKGKSWMMLGLGVAIAAGGVALNSVPVDPGDVLYLALEDNERRLQERLLRVLGGEPAPDRLHFFDRWPGLGEGGAEALDAWLACHPDARLVCVDVVARIRATVNGSANLYQADYQTMADLKRVADHRKVALVGVFHTRKADADDPLDTVSGTTGLAGAADTILVLTRQKGRADATLYVRGRDVPEAEHALSFDPETCRWSILGDAAEFRLSEERAAIRDVLRNAGEELAPKQIAEALGKKDGAVRFLIRKMAQAGEVIGTAGRYRLQPDTANSANPANSAAPANSPIGRDPAVGRVSGAPTPANARLRLLGANGAES